MNIMDGMRAIRNILKSNVKYWAVSNYPFRKQECTLKYYCNAGNIKAGGWYRNNFDCPPFNFPEPLSRVASHPIFESDNGDDNDDEFLFYEIRNNFNLTSIVQNWTDEYINHICDKHL